MLHRQINHSPDIKKLRDNGYEVEIIGNYLLVHSIPYLNAKKEIVLGTLVTNVSIANNQVTKPNNHVIHFSGEFPCNTDGTKIIQIQNASQTKNLAAGITINHTFSNKPPNGYPDYFEKVTQYIKIISAPAKHVDSSVTAKTYQVIEILEEDSVLKYSDTNSSKAEIDIINQKLSGLKIGIIGLGGTGSYILDFVAKTLVGEIHLFDGDLFLQHNAFRAPGAPSISELNESEKKVDYYYRIYSKMHKHVIPHALYINKMNLGLLNELDFVFVCIDKSEVKKIIFEKLESLEIPFIDTGIGVERIDDSLIGMVRTTTSSGKNRNHVWNGRIGFADDANDGYSTNIQIAELNALNAVFAVMKWKKLFGFYNDLENEFDSCYNLNINNITNNDSAA